MRLQLRNFLLATEAGTKRKNTVDNVDLSQSNGLINSLMAGPLLVVAPDGTYKPDLAL